MNRLTGFDVEFCQQQFADLVVYDAGSLLLRVAHARVQRVDSLRERLQARLGDVEPALLRGPVVPNRNYIGSSLESAGPALTRALSVLRGFTGTLFFFFFSFFFSHTFTFQLLDKPWSQLSSLLPPGSCLQFFIAHRVQQSHCSSIFHQVLLTHALALSARQFVHKKKSQRIYTSMHSAGLELTKLTYTRLEDNLIRHRGDRICRAPALFNRHYRGLSTVLSFFVFPFLVFYFLLT